MTLSARIPDLPALEVLLAVARTGSFNSAARQVGVTQQAVSARIRAAEAQAGVALVARTSRGSTLTPEGVVVANGQPGCSLSLPSSTPGWQRCATATTPGCGSAPA